MPIIGGLIILLQVSVIFHAMKTKRSYYWIFIIMAFPILGCLIYFAIEILPGSKQERHLKKFGKDIVKAMNPDADMKRHAEELAICGSVENKMKLAQELLERGMFDEAINLFESAREGQYVNAPDLLYGLSRARFFNGDHAGARGLLIELQAQAPRYYTQEVALMAARAAAKSGDRATALREIDVLMDTFVGLEARYRFAELLYEDGQTARAKAELERVIDHSKRFKVSAEEKSWAKLAQQGLASMAA
jgi:hypothetical protein